MAHTQLVLNDLNPRYARRWLVSLPVSTKYLGSFWFSLLVYVFLLIFSKKTCNIWRIFLWQETTSEKKKMCGECTSHTVACQELKLQKVWRTQSFRESYRVMATWGEANNQKPPVNTPKKKKKTPGEVRYDWMDSDGMFFLPWSSPRAYRVKPLKAYTFGKVVWIAFPPAMNEWRYINCLFNKKQQWISFLSVIHLSVLELLDAPENSFATVWSSTTMILDGFVETVWWIFHSSIGINN